MKKRAIRISVVLSVLFLLSTAAASQTIWYVDDDNTGGPWDGTQESPFQNIQDGIDAALDGDTVLVLPGTYVENIDFIGKAITVRSDGDGNPGTKDISPETTVIDGNNLWSVVRFESGEGLDSVIKGFTITNGRGVFIDSYRYGGGILCDSSSPTISDNTITDNNASFGGGICCLDSSPIITYNFINNNAGGLGGGAYLLNSSSIITNNSINSNNSGANGGGIYCLNCSSLKISNNTINGNVGGELFEDFGGGIYEESSTLMITNNTISGNSITYGGGIFSMYSSPTIEGNTITQNTGFSGVGGLGVIVDSSAEIMNNIISLNNGTTVGGGILIESADESTDTIMIKNNAITGNQATHGYGYGGGGCVRQLSIVSIRFHIE